MERPLARAEVKRENKKEQFKDMLRSKT